MEIILRQNNINILRDSDHLHHALLKQSKSLPAEWQGCCVWAIERCKQIHKAAERNLRYLNLRQSCIFPDILSETQKITREFLRLSRQASPILRGSDVDRVALRVLLWLHMSHRKTQGVPVALSNEDFSIWPEIPAMYFLPCSIQQSLLYLPLFFHEYGHLLYVAHYPEMDKLVWSLQEEIAEILEPMSHRADDMANQIIIEQQIVIERWYEWIQELFCDAVGLTIGGSAFVRSFSTYLRMRGRDQYLITRQQLEDQSHPVTWLRIKILAKHLVARGDIRLAASLELEWSKIADTMKVAEDYFGFYSDDFLVPLQKTLLDMLTEVEPIGLNLSSTDAPAVGGYINPIPFLIEAWDRFLASESKYNEWEKVALKELLSAF